MEETTTAAAARRYRFFAGKGGVGKTTCAAAAALGLAEGAENTEDRGTERRVLVASTDPAHSLGDALGRRLGPDPRPVPIRGKTGGAALWAVELSGERAFSRWLAPRRQSLRTAALRGTYLDEEDVDRLLALSPPGIDEIAALLDLERAAGETGCTEVVVDTAPTAHTLRLLATPEVLAGIAALLAGLQEKHRLLARHFGKAGAYQPDAVDRALEEIEAEGRDLAALLADAERTRFVWLLLPEALSLAEARDGVAALDAAGIALAEIVVNRVTPPTPPGNLQDERRREELRVIAEAAAAFPGRPLRFLPALDREPRGTPALRRVARALLDPEGGRELLGEPRLATGRARTARPRRRQRGARPKWPGVLAPPGSRLLLFGGKGGVGKTTCAAAAALALAGERPDERLLLLSTDPAHSLGDLLDVPLGDNVRQLPEGPPNLWARELDAERALEHWSADRPDRREAVAGLLAAFFGPPEGGDVVAEISESLSGVTPSGLDELMAVLALAEAVESYDRVVVDLAPTGHALRLLEMPALALTWDRALLGLLLKYREAVRPGVLAAELVELSRTLTRLSELLADPLGTRFIAVARAAELPRRETVRLIKALAGMGMQTAALVINAVEGNSADPELRRLAALAPGGSAILLAPALYPPPRGIAALTAWGRSWRQGVP
ncbi:MAG: arsenite/tail-anchored protein-transporting ATPase [Acidobacteriota bacterium]|nr:arsenite/tail-anchored protein-transporting ATPase [Acidobacteriota bacterium]